MINLRNTNIYEHNHNDNGMGILYVYAFKFQPQPFIAKDILKLWKLNKQGKNMKEEEQKRENECDGFGLWAGGSFFKTLKGTRFFCSLGQKILLKC